MPPPACSRGSTAGRREAVTAGILHEAPHSPEIALYRLPDGGHAAPSEAHPILLSYVDVVVQGYLREFGTAGAERFFETTAGWEAPILDDRAAPRYPRHQELKPDERAFVDAMLRGLSVQILHGTK